uniref:Uncharacterized protein n=1 Tax=Octactis speculum TaxID=3111310 RepID=A0A7S2DNA7_9STRA
MPSLLTAAKRAFLGDPAASHNFAPLNATEPIYLKGDGIDLWDALWTGDETLGRQELLLSAQPLVNGKLPPSDAVSTGTYDQWALRRADGMKLVWGTNYYYEWVDRGNWPPPGGNAGDIDASWSTVDCGESPMYFVGGWARLCNASTPCLYNVTSDPCEQRDLSKYYPTVVQEMRNTLLSYAPNATWDWKVYDGDFCDADANPWNHGGVWTPWKENGE